MIIFDNINEKFFMDYLYSVENYHTIEVKVLSNGFAGITNFCVSQRDLIQFLNDLEIAYEKFEGNINLNDSDSDSKVSIKFEKNGKLYVFGQLGASYNDHFMRFKFLSDQTIVQNIIHFIKRVIK